MANIRLPDHSHCIYCGDPIPFGEEYCNDECRQKEAERVAKEKKKNYAVYISAGVAIVIIVAVGLIV